LLKNTLPLSQFTQKEEHAERGAARLMAMKKWAYPNKSTLSYGTLRQVYLKFRSR